MLAVLILLVEAEFFVTCFIFVEVISQIECFKVFLGSGDPLDAFKELFDFELFIEEIGAVDMDLDGLCFGLRSAFLDLVARDFLPFGGEIRLGSLFFVSSKVSDHLRSV